MNLAWYTAFQPKDRLVVLYSELVNNTAKVMKDVLQFLGESISDDILECAMTRKEGIFKRSKKPHLSDVFDENMKTLINEKIRVLYTKLELPNPDMKKPRKEQQLEAPVPDNGINMVNTDVILMR